MIVPKHIWSLEEWGDIVGIAFNKQDAERWYKDQVKKQSKYLKEEYGKYALEEYDPEEPYDVQKKNVLSSKGSLIIFEECDCD